MTAKTILSLAQEHRKEPSRENYVALADSVRELVAERNALRAELCRQVNLVEKCMVAMNENADRGQKAEADAELWRAYKARKDAALAAGLGRSPLRDPQPKVTALPYMGKPEDKRHPYKPMTVHTDGVKRTKAIIVESLE